MFLLSILIHMCTYPIPFEIHAKLKKNVPPWKIKQSIKQVRLTILWIFPTDKKAQNWNKFTRCAENVHAFQVPSWAESKNVAQWSFNGDSPVIPRKLFFLDRWEDFPVFFFVNVQFW